MGIVSPDLLALLLISTNLYSDEACDWLRTSCPAWSRAAQAAAHASTPDDISDNVDGPSDCSETL
jgi:hypothetical protein